MDTPAPIMMVAQLSPLLQVNPIYGYLPIIVVLVIAVLIPFAGLWVGKLIRPAQPEQAKLLPYECGVDPVLDARERFSVRYYLVAMLFLIFDVETIFPEDSSFLANPQDCLCAADGRVANR